MSSAPEPSSHTEASSDSRYLSQLQFDPKLKKGFFHFFVAHTRVVILFIILLSGWGAYSYTVLPRESNPEVKIPIAIVTAVYPGASPGDVEELVTKKIEAEASSLKGVSKITSTSANSLSVTSIEFDASENIEDAVRSVRDAVNDAVPELPDDVQAPTVNEVSFDDRPMLTIVLTGPYDGFALRAHAEIIEDALEKIPGIRDVVLSGGDESEFSVAYNPTKLALYGMSPGEANRAIQSANIAVPGGNFDGKEFVYPIRSDSRFFDVATLASLPIRNTADGATVLLKDIAEVEERAIKRTTLSRLSIDGAAPENSVTIDIIKKTGGSIIDIAETVKTITEEIASSFPTGMRTDVTIDFSEKISEDFAKLGRDFAITIALVIITLFLIVGFKEALIAGLTIPLVFFATFGTMLLTGTSLNFLSLFSLLLALGLLVDDAIVVVSATKQYLNSGKFTPEEAVLLVLRDFKVVLLTTTLATTFAFLPLLLASGMIGQFIKSIPITVSTTLISSLIIALLINHSLAAMLERIRLTVGIFWALLLSALTGGLLAILFIESPLRFLVASLALAVFIALAYFRWIGSGETLLQKNTLLVAREKTDDTLIKAKINEQRAHDTKLFDRLMHGIIRIDHFIPAYERTLRFILTSKKRRLITLAGVVVLFLASTLLPISGLLKSEFFPPSDEDTLFINITAPIGTTLERTNSIAKEVEEKLRQYPEIENFSTLVGKPAPSQNRAGNVIGDASHTTGIIISLISADERNIASYDFATQIRQDLSGIRDADIIVESQAGGPPSGAAFEARISGENLQTLDHITNEFKNILGSIDGVTGIDVSLKEAPAEYTFTLDYNRMQLLGVDASSIGSLLRMAVSGSEITKVIRDNDDIKVIARIDERALPSLDALQNIQIVNKSGNPVYLKDVANIELKPSVNAITRIDEKRVVILSAGVVGNTNAQEVVKAFQEKVAEKNSLPEGYAIAYGGESEESAKSVQSILQAMVLAGLLIVSTLIIQFNSFRKAVIVLVTLPLALIGVFIGLTLFQISLSFPGLIGILALFGIVVKNAIILVDKININLRTGIPFLESIIDASKSRLEAIFITSLCTILGIMPITLSDDLWQALGSTIIFGLMFSSFLTLFIIPILYFSFASRAERAL